MIVVLPIYSTEGLNYTKFLYWSFAVVAAIILGLVIFFTYRYLSLYKAKSPTVQPQSGALHHKFEVIALITSFLITMFFMFFTVQSIKEIQTIPDHPEPDIIITGHQWWWEAEYPNSKVIIANEVHIPVGKKIKFKVSIPAGCTATIVLPQETKKVNGGSYTFTLNTVDLEGAFSNKS